MHSSAVKRQRAEVSVVVENATTRLHYCLSTVKYLKLANINEAKNKLNHILKKCFFAKVTIIWGNRE